MTVKGINLTLQLGPVIPVAAPEVVARSLESLEVTHSHDRPSVFQMRFRADRTRRLMSDFELLTSYYLKPSTRVAMTITVNGTPSLLFDGFITHQELVHEGAAAASVLSVTGEDVSALMDVLELSAEYPSMGDAAIVLSILARYSMVGVIPEVIPSASGMDSLQVERSPQQSGTDRNYINQLAAPHGYVFYVRPGPARLTNTAYWGPPSRARFPQKALTMDMGPATNVESISFQYDARSPISVYGAGNDPDTDYAYPVATVGSRRLPPLASRPSLTANPLFAQRQLFSDPRPVSIRGLDAAQSVTDCSTDSVVTASGAVDTLRYGALLSSPGIVGVRGAGANYDGNYFVGSVTHKISPGGYRQEFTISREGTGSTVMQVNP